MLTLKELKNGFKVLHFSPTTLLSLGYERGLWRFLAVAHWKNELAQSWLQFDGVQPSGQCCEEVTKL